MTKQNIYDELKKEVKELEKQSQTPEDENTAFIIDFYNKNNLKSPWVCKDIDEDKLFYWALSVMLYSDKTKTPKELYEINKSFFNSLNLRALCSLKIQLDALLVSMKQAAEESEINIFDPKVLKEEWDDIKELINSTMKLSNIDLLEKIITLKLTQSSSFDKAMLYIIAIKKFKSLIKGLRKKVSKEVQSNSFEMVKTQEETLKENIKFLYDGCNIASCVDSIFSQYENIYAEYITNQEQKNVSKRKIELYKALPEKIKTLLAQEEITDYKDLGEGLDENIKVAILTLINDHNQTNYKNIESSYIATKTNKCISYRLLFRKYGITDDIYQMEEMSKFSLEDTELFLNKLADLGINKPDALVQILKVGSLKAFDKLSKHIKKGIIKLDFAQNNPSLFDVESEVFKNATSNIDNIIDHNITPTYIMENQDVLLIPAEDVIRSIETLEEYELKSSLTPKTPSAVLAEKDLNLKLDTIIEQGHEQTLKDNLSIASYSKQEWKKIELLRQMNIEVTKEDLEDVLRAKIFIVSEDEIENYIIRALNPTDDNKINTLSPVDVNIYNPLETYSVSPLTYEIGGVLVSRKKVQRNLRKLSQLDMSNEEKILLSIQNNMSINSNELSHLKQSLGILYK